MEKTHRGKIDLIYIDPPYNTGNKDFIYDDAFVDKTDGFIHSKWISFMNERLKMARHLLSPQGALVISIGYQEIHNLNLLAKTYSSIGKLLRLQFKHLAESQMVDSITHKNIFCSLYQ